INEELEFRTPIQEERYGLTLVDIQTILKTMRYKHKVQFMCQLSSLMRIGELTQLRKKHLIADQENIIVKIPATIAKLKKGRTTFFSKEASKLLRPMLRKINDEDLVFGIKAETSVAQVLRRSLEKTGLNMKYESSGNYMISTHSFRAYGITKLSRHDPNFAKKIAGQKGYLDQYDRITDEEKLGLYQKYELDLIVDNTAKLKADNAKLAQEKNELEKVKMEKTMQKEQIDRLTKKITEIKTLEEKVNDLENFKEEMRREFMGKIKNLKQTSKKR
ncbi:MAG: site-specific integrase, partial [Nitrosopumilus sp.]|nr:site-specific integrase [Nitrosopumilus sp.]